MCGTVDVSKPYQASCRAAAAAAGRTESRASLSFVDAGSRVRAFGEDGRHSTGKSAVPPRRHGMAWRMIREAQVDTDGERYGYP